MSGMRKAINDMCKECIYDKFQEGTWREQVEKCTSPKCPLYKHRPITISSTKERAEDKKLNNQ